MGGPALGCLGEDPVVTPHLDALAASGRLLTEATSSYPVCSPCRAMLLSGAYPWVNGVWLNTNSQTAPLGVGLKADLRCWSDVLADEGYELGWVGKWHLDPPDEIDALYAEGRRDDDGRVWDHWTPPERRHGFGYWYAYGACDRHLTPHYWTTTADQTQPVRVDEWSPRHEAQVVSDFLRRAAVSYADSGQPFGMVWSINPPHQPFDEVPDEYRAVTSGLSDAELLVRPNVPDGPVRAEAAAIARDYFAAIHGVDEQIGRVLAVLDELGLRKDTVVVFTSDHGMQLGSHGLMYKNVPYEESVRVPMIWSQPGRIVPGHDDVLMGSVELAPTLLGLLAAADRPGHMIGADLSGRLLGDDVPGPDETMYLRIAGPNDPTEVRGIRTRTATFVVERAGDAVSRSLFDRATDPYELDDLADRRPDEVAVWSGRLRDLLSGLADPAIDSLVEDIDGRDQYGMTKT